mgnify:CR=1 FL=1
MHELTRKIQNNRHHFSNASELCSVDWTSIDTTITEWLEMKYLDLEPFYLETANSKIHVRRLLGLPEKKSDRELLKERFQKVFEEGGAELGSLADAALDFLKSKGVKIEND